MGREIVYCGECGSRILPEEFDRGQAITLNNKNYCAKCRKSVMPDAPAPPPAAAGDEDFQPVPLPASDRSKGSSALRRAVNVPLPQTTPSKGHPAVGRPQTRPAPRPRGAARGAAAYGGQGSNTGVIIAICVAVGALLLLLLLMATSSKKPRSTGMTRERTVGAACPNRKTAGHEGLDGYEANQAVWLPPPLSCPVPFI